MDIVRQAELIGEFWMSLGHTLRSMQTAWIRRFEPGDKEFISEYIAENAPDWHGMFVWLCADLEEGARQYHAWMAEEEYDD